MEKTAKTTDPTEALKAGAQLAAAPLPTAPEAGAAPVAPDAPTGTADPAIFAGNALASLVAAQSSGARPEAQLTADATDTGQSAATTFAGSRTAGTGTDRLGASASAIASLPGEDLTCAAPVGAALKASRAAAALAMTSGAAAGFASLFAGSSATDTAGVRGNDLLAGVDAAAAPPGTSASLPDAALATLQGGSGVGNSTADISRTVLHVGTPVGDPGFGQDVSRQLVYLAKTGTQSAELSLQPANLGPVSVSIQMNGLEASVAISASHEATRVALQEALPHLTQLFHSSGLQLVGAHVGDGSQRNTDPGAEQRHAAARSGAAAAAASEALPLAPLAPRSGGVVRLIDTFA